MHLLTLRGRARGRGGEEGPAAREGPRKDRVRPSAHARWALQADSVLFFAQCCNALQQVGVHCPPFSHLCRLRKEVPDEELSDVFL